MNNLNDKVNVSFTFIKRARCKKCAGEPEHYLYAKNKFCWESPRKQLSVFKWAQKSYKRFCNDYYLSNKPSDYKSTHYMSHSAEYKSYSPRLYKNTINSGFEFIDFLTCGCGYSVWAFFQKSSSERPEIYNRTGKYNFSK